MTPGQQWARLAAFSAAIAMGSGAVLAADTTASSGVPAMTVAANPTTPPQSSTLTLSTPQPLNPQELLAVQAVGAAVLQSRAHATEDPQIVATLHELEALEQTIQQALTPRPSTLTVMTTKRTLGQMAGQSAPALNDSAVRLQLASVHAARLRLEAKPAGVTNAMRLARRNAIAARTAVLEAAVQAALAAPAAERGRRLLALEQRLRPMSLSEEIASRAANPLAPGLHAPQTNSTPTITTLIHHR